MTAAVTTGEREAMQHLYKADLPDRLRMFLADCPPALAAKRDRIACRQLVTRTLFALAGGVRRTVYWHLAPEVPGDIDPYQLMALMFGKLNLLAYEGRELTHRNPAADTFALLANHLAGATTVTQLDECTVRIGDDKIAFWTIGDAFDGEDEDPVPDELPWSAATAHAVDVFGTPVPVWTIGSKIHFERTVTPGFVTV